MNAAPTLFDTAVDATAGDTVPAEFEEFSNTVGVRANHDPDYWIKKCLRAETERDYYRAALERIIKQPPENGKTFHEHRMQEIARAALEGREVRV